LYPQRSKVDDDNDNEQGHKGDGGEGSITGKGDPVIWKEIERRMTAGTLTEGRSWALEETEETDKPVDIDMEPKRRKRREGEKKKEDRGGKAKTEDHHDESDGGFFEE
jgi:hypothetical protein